MDLRAYMRERATWVDRHLDAHLPRADDPPAQLHAAMRHLLFPGGKRFRPVLSLAACEAVGAPPERVIGFAAAVELVHTYSLVHGALPCKDDDDERRGIPTVHKAFDESTAVLAGDALFAAAFEVLLADPEALPEARLMAARELAEAAGARGLVGGQVDDLAAAEGTLDLSGIESIHRRKTGALIRVALVGSARLAGALPVTIEALGCYGDDLGSAFQIADDLLDHEESGVHEPCSFVTSLGVERARERLGELLASALESVEPLGEPAEPLRELARYAVRRRQ